MKKISFKKNNTRTTGFTIIETMISIGIFLIVVTIGMTALLNASSIHNKSQNQRSIMDNLSFIMEDMSRNIRTGYDYHCIDSTNNNNLTLTDRHSCPTGGGISFKSQNWDPTVNPYNWVYYFCTFVDSSGVNGIGICKSTDSGSTHIQLNPDEVKFDSASGFTVIGAEPPPGDIQQPFVIIRLVGKITSKGTATPFSLQTSVSQRLVDI